MRRRNTPENTGPEKFEDRIHITDLLTGASAALWLVPIILILNPVRHDVFVFATVFAAASSMATFLLGVVYRSQRQRNEQQIDVAAAVAENRDHMLGLRELILDLQLYTQAQGVELANRIERVAARVERDRWNVYTEAWADLQGGEDVVDATPTRKLNQLPAPVVKLPQHRVNGKP